MSKKKKARRQEGDTAEEGAEQASAGHNLREISGLPEFDEELGSGMAVLVDFWAPWCQPCKLVGPIFDSLAEQYGEKVRFLRVNVEANPQIAQALNVRSIPTMVAFWGGQVYDVRVGAAPRPAMERLVKKLIDKAEGRTIFSKVKGLFRRQSEPGGSSGS